MVVYVRQHSTGANIIQISMVEPDYPPALLQRQINDLGASLDYPPRGLSVYQHEMIANNPKLRFLKADFAVAGLTGEDGQVFLTPLVRAFVGAPEPHTIKALTVVLDGFLATPKTLHNFKSEAVEVRGQIQTDPPTVQYEIELHSQNPSEINITLDPPKVESQPQRAPARRVSPSLVWGLIILSGLAAGALVYFLLLRRPTGGPPKTAARKL